MRYFSRMTHGVVAQQVFTQRELAGVFWCVMVTVNTVREKWCKKKQVQICVVPTG